MTKGDLASLRASLVATGIAGMTRTPRDNCVDHAIKLADGDPDKALGIGARGRDAAQIMADVAALCGCSPDLADREGGGFIDPDIVAGAFVRLGERLAVAADRRERVLITTGHPTGLLGLYGAIARALKQRGATILTPLDDQAIAPPKPRRRRRAVLYTDGVGTMAAASDLIHTHESWQMDRLLDAIDAPDLILADHGFAGAAIARGLEVVSLTDVNDPAIAVAKALGLVDIVVPCDDNLPPASYEQVADLLVGMIGDPSGSSWV